MSSTSSITTTAVNGTSRITGLSSGIDVDSIVEQLMSAEKAKLNKLQQKEQLTQWRQEAYRSIIADIQNFTGTYFSSTASSNLMSAAQFNQYTVSSTTSAVKATANGDAAAGNHTVEVFQLATAAKLSSSSSISKAVQGAAAADYSNLSGTAFVIELDGTGRTVALDNVTDLSSLQSAINAAVGEGKVTVNEDSSTGYLVFTAADSGVQQITISDPVSGASGLSGLGFTGDAVLSNRLDPSVTLAAIAGQLNAEDFTFNDDGQIELNINGIAFTFDQDDTLDDMINEINGSDAKVAMEYDELSGRLIMTADNTGAGSTLIVTEDGISTFLSAVLSVTTAGLDAKISIDGTDMTRSSNAVTVDGVKYTFNQTTSSEATVSLIRDTEAIYDLIDRFVDDYNTLISTMNAELDASYDPDYPPLTDDQKEEMTEEEIANWEEKAKTGLLANDSVLTGFLRELRTSLTDSVAGQTASIFSIGISTGTYDEEGKLYIEENALKEAIESDPEGVMNLFAQKSETYPSNAAIRSLTSSQLAIRREEEGIANRFYDVLAKYTSAIRDSNGDKGLLLGKAGIEDDTSETDNSLSALLEKYTEEISDEQDRLDEYEENLYNKYTTLETYISNMNSQLSALASYLNTSS